jgi:hypothetical protein
VIALSQSKMFEGSILHDIAWKSSKMYSNLFMDLHTVMWSCNVQCEKDLLIILNIINWPWSNSSTPWTHIELLCALQWPYSLSSETHTILPDLARSYYKLITWRTIGRIALWRTWEDFWTISDSSKGTCVSPHGLFSFVSLFTSFYHLPVIVSPIRSFTSCLL